MKQIYLRILTVGAFLSLACTTKVSEWVLLNSAQEQYLLVYFHDNELSENEKLRNSELESRFMNTNIILKSSVSAGLDNPYYALYLNDRLISEYRQYKALDNIASSPLRKAIATDLKGGMLCTMLYLECGNEAKDNRCLDVVRKAVKDSPFGEIITIYELDRNSAEESQFVRMLLNVEPDLPGIMEPMLFGIFGRFRALEPLVANGISEENISLMIDFLTADCSCLIKDNLPGSSILFSGKWENPKPALLNDILDRHSELIHH